LSDRSTKNNLEYVYYNVPLNSELRFKNEDGGWVLLLYENKYSSFHVFALLHYE